MPKLAGITFNREGHKLAKELIARLQTTGDLAVYGLPKMQKGKGEVRLAHHGRDLQHKKARGVFGRIIPTQSGASFTCRKGPLDDSGRIKLTAGSFKLVVRTANAKRALTKDRVKGSVKVPRHKPGTVSGGRPESNPRKF